MILKKLCTLIMVLCSFCICSSVLSSPIQTQKIIKLNPEKISQYWTKERLRKATPMELPKVNSLLVSKMSNSEYLQRQRSLKSIVKLGELPTVKPQLNIDNILDWTSYKTKNTLDSINSDVANQPFSSQRVFPFVLNRIYPYSAVGKLFFTDKNNIDKTCSASVIGKRIILTAAHCVYPEAGDNPNRNFYFIPGYRNKTSALGEWPASGVAATVEWFAGKGEIPSAHDFAIVILNYKIENGALRTISEYTGSLGFISFATIPNHIHILGYSDNLDAGEEMHQITAGDGIPVEPFNAEYGSDMRLGSAGSPWIQSFGPAADGQEYSRDPGRNLVVGVTSYGYEDPTIFSNGSSVIGDSFKHLYSLVCLNYRDAC